MLAVLVALPLCSAPLPPLAQKPGDWVTLFDGKTLDGWVTEGGRYDGKASWTVEDGAICGREGEKGAGGLIYTEQPYGNFELELDAFVSWPFDSGIFPRMRPRSSGEKGAQVTIDYRPGGEVGGIYSDGWYMHNPEGAARFKKDDWNRFEVRCVGNPMHIQVKMNGEPLTDYRFTSAEGFASEGLIGLQVHGSAGAPENARAMFKNVRVRRLPDDAGDYFRPQESGVFELTKAGAAAGWKPLFDGKSLKGWKGAGDGSGYRARDGVLEFLVKGKSPHLVTEADYGDFHLRLDFKIAKMANSGLFLRADRDGSNPAYSGCEIQILDDFNWEKETGSKLAPYQFTGGLYGAVPNKQRDALRPLGEWNTYEIRYVGSRLHASLNGRVMYDIDTHELKDVKPPFAERAETGFIGLQRHAPARVEGDAYAWFRNLYIREL
ncbi:MAG: DUF1080 domain-containing protein [bacterium]|nr:DUF1080 domain-containing protein [bacterium]